MCVYCLLNIDYKQNELVAQCQEYAKESGATITLTSDVKEGTKDADVIYTDVWVSMGEPDEVWEKRIKELSALSSRIPRSEDKDRKRNG